MEVEAAAARGSKLTGARDYGPFRMPWHLANSSRYASAPDQAAAAKAKGASSLLAADASITTECMPLFMEMDIATSFNGPAMIFGLPFLRRYAARFDRSAQTVALGEIPLGSSLCTHCGDTHDAASPSALIAGTPARRAMSRHGLCTCA